MCTKILYGKNVATHYSVDINDRDSKVTLDIRKSVKTLYIPLFCTDLLALQYLVIMYLKSAMLAVSGILLL